MSHKLPHAAAWTELAAAEQTQVQGALSFATAGRVEESSSSVPSLTECTISKSMDLASSGLL